MARRWRGLPRHGILLGITWHAGPALAVPGTGPGRREGALVAGVVREIGGSAAEAGAGRAGLLLARREHHGPFWIKAFRLCHPRHMIYETVLVDLDLAEREGDDGG
jgi:hypothetical protein